MNTLLFGNGLNLLSNKDSWEKLVKTINTEPTEDKIPNTMQFDIKLYSFKKCTSDGEKQVKRDICREMKNYKSNEIYDKIAELGIENYITTNYDFTIQSALMKAGFVASNGCHKETTYSIYRYVEYEDENLKTKKVWNIHGELNRPNSIMLGYKHYGDYTGKIIDYINNSCWKEESNQSFSVTKSWVDLLFSSNLYIMGLGLYYEEIDLWWLLSYRKRLQIINPALCTNQIIYFGECQKGKKELLNSLGIEVFTSLKRDYVDKYNEYIDVILERLER